MAPKVSSTRRSKSKGRIMLGPALPKQLRDMRLSFGLSRDKLAGLFNVHGQLVRGWEQGEAEPNGAALTIFWLMKEHPEVRRWLREFQEAPLAIGASAR